LNACVFGLTGFLVTKSIQSRFFFWGGGVNASHTKHPQKLMHNFPTLSFCDSLAKLCLRRLNLVRILNQNRGMLQVDANMQGRESNKGTHEM